MMAMKGVRVVDALYYDLCLLSVSFDISFVDRGLWFSECQEAAQKSSHASGISRV